MLYNLLVVLGPTASGKTKFAAHLAYCLNGEVISADSRQVYRGMDIGTGKDLADYTVENRNIPYHLIDIVDAGYQYNVFEYQKDFVKEFNEITSRNVFPVLCGGSGMYIESIIKNYRLTEVPPDNKLRSELEKFTDNELADKLLALRPLHNTTDSSTRKRVIRAIEIALYQNNNPVNELQNPVINPLIVGLNPDREIRRARITCRLEDRLNQGMIQEAENLINNGVPPEMLEYYGLEYKFLAQYITGRIDFDTMKEHLNIAIHQFAKRQMTWFRRMEKQGIKINWIDVSKPFSLQIEQVLYLLSEKNT